jgi:hypothetical protein
MQVHIVFKEDWELVAVEAHADPHKDKAESIAADLLEAREACIPLIAANSLAGDLLRAAIAKAKGGAA